MNKIKESLDVLFSDNRVVFWYDDNSNLKEQFEELQFLDVEKIEVKNARDAFRDMSDSLEPLGIFFNFEFDDTIHDRSIELNNGWKIILGRGLDIW